MKLYVAYQAKEAFGYVILNNWKAPLVQKEVELLCETISKAEGITHVVPMFWQELSQ